MFSWCIWKGKLLADQKDKKSVAVGNRLDSGKSSGDFVTLPYNRPRSFPWAGESHQESNSLQQAGCSEERVGGRVDIKTQKNNFG